MTSSARAAARAPWSAAALRRALGRRPRQRLAAVVAIGALLAGGYLLWFRDSALVRVERVTVTGLTSHDAGRVRSALAGVARQMTTLHVDRARLERATAAFPVVRSIEVGADFPHGMRIHVVEHRPAAMLVARGRRIPVAVDGSVLSGLPVRVALPVVHVAGALPADRMSAGAQLASVEVAAGRPAALAARVKEVRRERGRGIVAIVAGGPRIVFGDATRVAAKWAAAVRVLADLEPGQAEYVDVRLPGRPVAGGLRVETLAPLAPAGDAGASEPAAAAATPAAGADAPASSARPVSPAPSQPTAPAPTTRAPQTPRVAPPQPTVGEGGGAAPSPQP